ncbi:hypothetical protein MKK69_02880 [Methylobacterium sp. J-026]|uniref:hypothetical protein n=1 Tax=Methylobacterium sp. J-026 TaxID=2836624 RepID=UPI001FBAE4FF|nr:hypothetical protein [Methylobacterium sp. J-026]MCJ2133020.1 hypothetical protein [Methylobacterium sp. J-026]
MGENVTVIQLRAKQGQLQDHVAYLEKKLEEARADLIHVNAVLRLFELPDDGQPLDFPVHMNLSRLFSTGELMALAKAAMTSGNGAPLNTRDIAAFVIHNKGWDIKDPVLRHSVAHRLVYVLAKAARRGVVVSPGYEKGVRLWALPTT